LPGHSNNYIQDFIQIRSEFRCYVRSKFRHSDY